MDSANGPGFVVCDPSSAGCSREVARVASRVHDVLGETGARIERRDPTVAAVATHRLPSPRADR